VTWKVRRSWFYTSVHLQKEELISCWISTACFLISVGYSIPSIRRCSHCLTIVAVCKVEAFLVFRRRSFWTNLFCWSDIFTLVGPSWKPTRIDGWFLSVAGPIPQSSSIRSFPPLELRTAEVFSHPLGPQLNFSRGLRSWDKSFLRRPVLGWKLNSVALVRKRTIPIERPPLVGEVSTNFCG
jgi:hypothetical protein